MEKMDRNHIQKLNYITKELCLWDNICEFEDECNCEECELFSPIAELDDNLIDEYIEDKRNEFRSNWLNLLDAGDDDFIDSFEDWKPEKFYLEDLFDILRGSTNLHIRSKITITRW